MVLDNQDTLSASYPNQIMAFQGFPDHWNRYYTYDTNKANQIPFGGQYRSSNQHDSASTNGIGIYAHSMRDYLQRKVSLKTWKIEFSGFIGIDTNLEREC